MMREPSADLREAARGMRELYEALVESGFGRFEALFIIAHMMASVGSSAPQQERPK